MQKVISVYVYKTFTTMFDKGLRKNNNNNKMKKLENINEMGTLNIK